MQESLFFYEWYSDDAFRIANDEERAQQHGREQFAAFTVSELLDLLPSMISKPAREGFAVLNYYFKLEKTELRSRSFYWSIYERPTGGILPDRELYSPAFCNIKCADALAEFLIYLIEKECPEIRKLKKEI
jgi:hypothetical protein